MKSTKITSVQDLPIVLDLLEEAARKNGIMAYEQLEYYFPVEQRFFYLSEVDGQVFHSLITHAESNLFVLYSDGKFYYVSNALSDEELKVKSSSPMLDEVFGGATEDRSVILKALTDFFGSSDFTVWFPDAFYSCVFPQ